MTTSMSVADNPALANQLLQTALSTPEESVNVQVTLPPDTSVTLPGGYITTAGEVVTDAEVRELNGKDEEAISRTTSLGKAILVVLQRGVVRIGNQKCDDKILDRLLSGDRDMLLLAIFKATFGNTVDLKAFCAGCNEEKDVTVDLNTDIPVKILTDPVGDRTFTVQGKTQDITVQLPTGVTQKELILNADKTASELTTLLLGETVIKIGDTDVLSKIQVQNLGVADRRAITEEINKRVPGPQFTDLSVTCPDCGSEVRVSVNFGALFQF